MTTQTRIKVHGIQMEHNGGPEVLKVSDFEIAEPGPGHALVKLHMAGVNFIDIYHRTGKYPVQLPYVPGLEGAGVVEKVGPGVSEVKPGDRVAYTSTPGSYAQANVVPVYRLIPVPAEMPWEQAAAFPLQGMTAQYLLYEFHRVKPGETVLVHAAAGGVGLLLVQWLKHLGARVVGTVSTEEKAQLVKEAGAADVILYTKQDFVKEIKKLTNDKGAEYIIDGVGKDTFTKNLEAVATRGHITIFGSSSGPADPVQPNSLQMRSITVSGGSLFAFANSRDEVLARANAVLSGVKEGWLKLKTDHIFPLSQAAKAHELLEGRKTTGKVVLNCAE
jgi:NADPH2:quinone reductase